MDSIFEWVEGHPVERNGWALCSLQECLNDRADNLAKRALITGYTAEEYIENDLPFEQMQVKIAGTKVTGYVQLAVDRVVGEHVARRFSDRKHILSSQNFDFVL